MQPGRSDRCPPGAAGAGLGGAFGIPIWYACFPLVARLCYLFRKRDLMGVRSAPDCCPRCVGMTVGNGPESALGPHRRGLFDRTLGSVFVDGGEGRLAGCVIDNGFLRRGVRQCQP